MPELPEVETIARGLHTRVAGDAIESVWIGSRKQPLKSPAGLIAATLKGKRIVRVQRVGKHIVFDLEGEAPPKKGRRAARVETRLAASPQRSNAETAQWIVHLGMTGRMVVSEPAADIAKHTHLIAKLASGRELRFIDPRMFGKLSVHSGGFDPGGVEPFEVSEERFVALVSRAQDSDQERAAESEAAARRGQYLRRRIFVSRRNSSPAARGGDQREQLGKLLSGGTGSAERGDRAGRFIHFRLCGRGWRRRIFPAPASRLRPRRRAVPGVRDSNPAGCARGPQQSLLPEMSKIALIERFNILTDCPQPCKKRGWATGPPNRSPGTSS